MIPIRPMDFNHLIDDFGDVRGRLEAASKSFHNRHHWPSSAHVLTLVSLTSRLFTSVY